MRAIGSAMTTPEIRRRLPSYQYDDDGDCNGTSSIRPVISSNTPTSTGSVTFPYTEMNKGKSYRKAVPAVSEEQHNEEEVAVVRAGNILMQQVALQAQRRSSTSSSAFMTAQDQFPELLPSPIEDRRPSQSAMHEKAKYSDQPFEEEEEEDCHIITDNDESQSERYPYHDHRSRFLSGHGLPQLTVPAPTHGNLVPPPPPLIIERAYEEDLISSSSATSTLAGIGRSLQWSQKFPQGRHLSRAKSRTTLREKDAVSSSSSSNQLTEARAGLRLLAKRREDVIEEDQVEVTRKAKWNNFKWILFISVIFVFLYATLGLIGCLLTWAEAWDGAKVSVLVDTDIVILLSVASSLCLLTSMVGLSGTILNSRPILALYAFLLWPSLLSMLTVGYTSYKRNNLRLDLKLNMTWSRYLDDLARLRVQEILQCCGYYSPLHQATFSRYCYPRTTLPGCKGPLYRFERRTLAHLYTVVFTVVFAHLTAIAVSILCSNHVNVPFGKGLTPRAYRLDVGHVRRNAVNIIRILSHGASGTTDVHHLLQVDNAAPIPSNDSSRPSFMSRDSFEGWKL